LSGIFRALASGSSGAYYRDIMKSLYVEYKDQSFLWVDVYRKFPTINKSVLSRLKCSGVIQKNKSLNKHYKSPVLWKLHPEVKDILERSKLI